MKKELLTLAFVLFGCMSAFPQATSLTIDCQNPGWLSSKIGYGDQQSVVDLTVTGYLNNTDMEFLGTLMKLHSLKRLDLEQVNIVSSDADKQNVLTPNVFNIDGSYVYMEKIVLPLSITKFLQSYYVDQPGSFSNWLYVDTLVLGGPAMPTIENNIYGKRRKGTSFASRVRCLMLREGVETIPDDCFYYDFSTTESISLCIFDAVSLPSSLKSIGVRAFCGNKFKKLDLPESLEKLEMDAFRGAAYNLDTLWRPDTLFLPASIKRFNISAFNTPSKVYYFPEGIEYIDNKGHSVDYLNSTDDIITSDMLIEFHIKNATPPVFNSGVNCLKKSVVYVPKGASAQYKNTSPWKYATIIEEEKHVKGITLNYNSYELDYIGESFYIEAMVVPDDATNKDVKWTSSNESVCIVSHGMVFAIGKGTCVIIATTEDGGYIATCVVTVTSATGISSAKENDEKIYQIYDVNGTKQAYLKKGINIIQFTDGSSRKVLLK